MAQATSTLVMSAAVLSPLHLPCRIARTIVASVSLVRILVLGPAPSADLVRVEPNEALLLAGMTAWAEAEDLVGEALAVLGAAATVAAEAVMLAAAGTDNAEFMALSLK